MAKAYAKNDDYENALKYAQKVCRETNQALGEKDSLSLLSLCALSEIYSSMGRYEKALETDEKVYALMQGTCNEQNQALQLNQLACSHVLAGSGKGKAYLEKAYEAMCDAFGEEHPYTLMVYANLASRYAAEGDTERAQKILENVCEADAEKVREATSKASLMDWIGREEAVSLSFHKMKNGVPAPYTLQTIKTRESDSHHIVIGIREEQTKL
jgi:tetratricopeptide (TPR) repeat protein